MFIFCKINIYKDFIKINKCLFFVILYPSPKRCLFFVIDYVLAFSNSELRGSKELDGSIESAK